MSQQFSIPVNYPALPSADPDIPSSMLPADLKRLEGCQITQKSVPTSSGTVGASSTLLFQIPTGMGQGYLKSGTAYIRCKFVLDISNPTLANSTWGFAGGDIQNNVPSELWGGGSSLFERVVISSGGTQINVINNYRVFRDQVILHASSPSYLDNDLRVLEMAGSVKAYSPNNGDNSLTAYLSIPLLCPFLNSSNHVPLFLLNSPITVEITTSSFNSAMYLDVVVPANPVAIVGTGYSISEASLVYESLDVSSQYKQAMIQRLAQSGSAYTMEMNDCYNMSVGINAVNGFTSALEFNVGLSLSSLKSVLYTFMTNGQLNAPGPKAYGYNSTTNFQIYVDNRLINSVIIDNQQIAFSELQKALGRYGDPNLVDCISGVLANDDFVVPALTNTSTDYASRKFAYGVNCQTINDYNYSITGIPCQQLTVRFDSFSGTNTDANIKWGFGNTGVAGVGYIFVFHDTILTIGADGTVALRR